MNIFKQLFKVLQSFLHAFVNHIQDPILMAEQAIRDLKRDYDASMKNLAEVKALAIEAKEVIAQQTEVAKDYEKKALTIVQKGQTGELDQAKADRLASEALKKKQSAIEMIKKATLDVKNYESMANTMEISSNVEIPVMTASGISVKTASMALAAGACAVGVGSAVNKCDSFISMIATVRSLVEATSMWTFNSSKSHEEIHA